MKPPDSSFELALYRISGTKVSISSECDENGSPWTLGGYLQKLHCSLTLLKLGTGYDKIDSGSDVRYICILHVYACACAYIIL